MNKSFFICFIKCFIVSFSSAICSFGSLFKAIDLNYDFAITFDADGQHVASDFKKFKNFINKGYDLILGERPYILRFSEKIGKLIFFNKWGIKDPFCGFKGYNLKKVKKFNFFERYIFTPD
mgnify:CR=1 FL=1